ncbi:MAG TPA: MFS transporter [Streptosporangiaceae bacterium]|jgi:EmrB/QacA subfamily drug resistance transporter|nr:MFS transporter [Streptosporangiaceae bacterium]
MTRSQPRGPAREEPAAERPSTPRQRRRLRLAVWVVSLGQLMAVLDTTIVNIALPRVQGALGFSGTSLEWVVNAYSLCLGGLLLLGGRSADILGRRRVFTAGIAVFTAASLLGGLAVTQWWLLAARAAQGTGAAFAVPSGLALIADTFPQQRERRRAVGMFTAIGAGGGAFGILVGGLLTTFVNWRAVFFVNVPIGVAILIAAPRVLGTSQRHRNRFDLLGALAGTGAVTLLVYALIEGATDAQGASHWRSPVVLVSAAVALALAAGFVARETRVSSPLVPMGLFARRARAGAYAVTTCIDCAMFGNLFFLTLFLQRVWNYSPLATAAVYIPPALMLTAGGPVASRLIGRTGAKRLLLIGLAVAAAGMYGMSRMGEHGSYLTEMLLPTVIGYAGVSLTRVPLITTALDRVPEGSSGVASGIYTTARQVGGATGLAVVGAFAWAVVAGTVSAARPGAVFGAPGLPAAVTRRAMAAGADRGFLAAAVIVLIGLVIAALTIHGESAEAEPSR